MSAGTDQALDQRRGDALIEAAVAQLAATGATITAFGIAVSGGADSMALMALVAGWAKRKGSAAPRLHVVTVDHGLRRDSASEAEQVAAGARQLGLAHTTLAWIGEKTATGLQEAARDARYGLLGAFAREHGLAAVLVAHTADDQAETFLMRLAHGSGVDGLAAMAVLSRRHGLVLLRPFLDVSKRQLVATLRAAGMSWIEDPSNHNVAFERIRVRQAASALGAIGLTAGAIGMTAKRLARASSALELTTTQWLGDPTMFTGAEFGFARFDLKPWRASAHDIQVRALGRLLAVIGGQAAPIAMTGIESLVIRLQGANAKGATLARCVLSIDRDELTIVREDGRVDLPSLALRPGESALWDNRFVVQWGTKTDRPVEVRALGLDGAKQAVAADHRPDWLPVGALRTLPAFWQGHCLLAAPNLARTLPPEMAGAALTGNGTANASFLAFPGYRLPDQA